MVQGLALPDAQEVSDHSLVVNWVFDEEVVSLLCARVVLLRGGARRPKLHLISESEVLSPK